MTGRRGAIPGWAGGLAALVLLAPVVLCRTTAQRAVGPRPTTTLREFVPLAHARYFGDAELTLANFGPDPIVVNPVWLVRGNDTVEGPPITLPPHVPQFLQLARVLPEGVTLATVDGLFISYVGVAVMEVAVQATLIPKSGSQLEQSVDAPPTIPVDARGHRIEAVWPAPRHDERAIIVLTNLADTPSTIQMTRPNRTERIELGSGEVRLLPEETSETGRGVEWVQFDSNQTGLRASGFVLSRTDRVPHLLRFYDPSSMASSSLWANDVRLSSQPLVSLKNTRTIDVRAMASLLDPTDGHLLVDLPPIALGPGAAAVLNLASSAGRPSGLGALRVVSSEGEGSVVGALQSVDQTTGLQSDAPLRDSGWDNTSYRRGTGDCVWRLDDDYDTRVVLTNIGDTDAKFNLVLRAAAQQYVFEQEKLALGATVTLDLRRIRDQRATDRMHRALPPGADRGTCHWSVIGSPDMPSSKMRLMGRAEIVSPSRRVSSTHTF